MLALLAVGLSNAEIAAALVIEESTVETHVKRIILMKLNGLGGVHELLVAKRGFHASHRRIGLPQQHGDADRHDQGWPPAAAM